MQDEDFEDEMEFTPSDNGVNELEESYSLEDPQVQAMESEALGRIMLETAKYYKVSSVLKVSESIVCFYFSFLKRLHTFGLYRTVYYELEKVSVS